jgi:hypothetical protein
MLVNCAAEHLRFSAWPSGEVTAVSHSGALSRGARIVGAESARQKYGLEPEVTVFLPAGVPLDLFYHFAGHNDKFIARGHIDANS